MGIKGLMARAIGRKPVPVPTATSPVPDPTGPEQPDALARRDVETPRGAEVTALGPYRLSPVHRQIVALTAEAGRFELSHVALYDAIPALAATDGRGLVIVPMDRTGEGGLPDVRTVIGGLAPARLREPDVLVPKTVLQMLPTKLGKGATDVALELTRKGQVWTARFAEKPYGRTWSVDFEASARTYPDIWDIVRRGLGLKPRTMVDVNLLAGIARAMDTESLQMSFEDEKGVIALRGSGAKLDLAGTAIGMLMPITPASSAQPTE